ncbi:hypothetical protein [Chryseobacterium lineare]
MKVLCDLRRNCMMFTIVLQISDKQYKKDPLNTKKPATTATRKKRRNK